MVGDRVRVRSRALSQQGLADPAVPDAPPGRQDALVERLADQRVGKVHGQAILGRPHDVGLDGALDDGEEHLLRCPARRNPQRERHHLADDCRDGEKRLRLRAEPRHTCVDHLPKQRGNPSALEWAEMPTI